MILERILAAKRAEIEQRKASVSAAELERLVRDAPRSRDFAAAVARGAGDPIRLIAEFKRASPSRGTIRADLAPEDVARGYEAAGASAMSVLTDGPFFSGSLDDLKAARAGVKIPVLRKDFMLDAYQLLEARSAGADAVLLIVAALSDQELAELHTRSAALGLAALVEVHNHEELERALAVSPRIVGINNRDLKTFKVEMDTTLRLRGLIREGVIVVSESGIRSREDMLRLESAGVDAALVGETLMRQADPGAAARELLAGLPSGETNLA